MRNSGWTPSIVPRDDDQNVYVVLDDLGRSGRACRETDVERTDLKRSSWTCSRGNTKAWSA